MHRSGRPQRLVASGPHRSRRRLGAVARVVDASPPGVAAASSARLGLWADALDSLVDATVRAEGARLELKRVRSPVARAWMRALTGFDRGFTADADALA